MNSWNQSQIGKKSFKWLVRCWWSLSMSIISIANLCKSTNSIFQLVLRIRSGPISFGNSIVDTKQWTVAHVYWPSSIMSIKVQWALRRSVRQMVHGEWSISIESLSSRHGPKCTGPWTFSYWFLIEISNFTQRSIKCLNRNTGDVNRNRDRYNHSNGHLSQRKRLKVTTHRTTLVSHLVNTK